MRFFLALVSLAAGAALLGVAAVSLRRTAKERGHAHKKPSALWIYAGLFLVTAALLWQRSHSVDSRHPASADRIQSAESLPVDTVQESMSQPPAQRMESEGRWPSDPWSVPGRTGSSAAIPGKASADGFSLYDREHEGGSPVFRGPVAGRVAIETDPDSRWADSVYAAVLRAFDAIEDWFYDYGWAADSAVSWNVEIDRPDSTQDASFQMGKPVGITIDDLSRLNERARRRMRILTDQMKRYSAPAGIGQSNPNGK